MKHNKMKLTNWPEILQEIKEKIHIIKMKQLTNQENKRNKIDTGDTRK